MGLDETRDGIDFHQYGMIDGLSKPGTGSPPLEMDLLQIEEEGKGPQAGWDVPTRPAEGGVVGYASEVRET